MADNYITLEEFTSATSFSFAGIKLTQMDPKDLEDVSELNYDAIGVTQNSAVDELLAGSAKTDGSEAPQTPSYQPLNEAGLAIAGKSAEDSTLATAANTSDAFLNKGLESLKKAVELVPDPNTAAFGDIVQDATGALAAISSSMATAAEKANGSITFSAGSNLRIAGNQLFLSSEGVISEAAPTKISNTNNSVRKAHSATEIYDGKNTIGKTEAKQTKQSIGIHQTKQTVASGSHRTFAGEDWRIATGVARTAGDVAETYARHNQISATETFSMESAQTGLIRTGDLNLGAAAGTISPVGLQPTNADGKTVGQVINQAKGNVNIFAKGDKTKGEGQVSMFNEGFLNSSQGAVYTLANEKITTISREDIASVAQNVATVGNKSLTLGTTKGGTALFTNGTSSISMVGRRTNIQRLLGGLVAFNTKTFQIPGLTQIPKLTPFPTPLTTETLESCIPEDFKAPKEQTPEQPVDEEEKLKEQIKPTKQNRDNPIYKRQGKLEGLIIPSPSGALGNESQSPEELAKRREALKQRLRDIRDTNGSGEGTRLAPPIALSTVGSDVDQSKPPQSAPNKAVAANMAFKSGADVFLSPCNIVNPLSIEPDNDADEGDDTTIETEVNALTPLIIDEAGAQLGIPSLTIQQFKDNIPLIQKLNILTKESLTILSTIDELAKLLPNETQDTITKIEALLKLPQAIELLNSTIDSMNSIAGVGGLFGSIGGIVKGLTSGLQIAKSLSSLSGNPLAIYQTLTSIPGVSSVVQKLTDSILPKSGFIADIGKAILNREGSIEDILVKAAKDKLKQVAEEQIAKLGGKYGSAGLAIYDLLQTQKTGKPINQEELITKIAGILGDATGVDEINKAISLYDNLKPILKSISSGDLSSLLKDGVLEGLVGSVLGEKAVGVIGDLRGIYGKGMKLYETIKAVPELLKMMNGYKIPLLNQVGILLGCLDIIDQILGIFNSVKNALDGDDSKDDKDDSESASEDTEVISLPGEPPKPPKPLKPEPKPPNIGEVTAEDVLRFIENLPRLTQVFNSIQEIPESTLLNNTYIPHGITPAQIGTVGTGGVNNESPVEPDEADDLDPSVPPPILPTVPITVEELVDIRTLTIEVRPDACYVIPKLNYLEASVEVMDVFDGQVLFTMPYNQLLQVNGKNVYPNRGDVIQVRISGFRRERDNMFMSIPAGMDYFTPAVYSFTINDFDTNGNLGIASILPMIPYIHLRGSDSLTYQYATTDIGSRLIPIVEDAYIIL